VQFLFIFSVVDNDPVSLGSYVYPQWADGIGWLMFAIAVVLIPLIAVVEAVKIRRDDTSLSTRVRLIHFLNSISHVL